MEKKQKVKLIQSPILTQALTLTLVQTLILTTQKKKRSKHSFILPLSSVLKTKRKQGTTTTSQDTTVKEMGNITPRFRNQETCYDVAIVGLQGSGKTEFVSKLKLHVEATFPVDGFVLRSALFESVKPEIGFFGTVWAFNRFMFTFWNVSEREEVKSFCKPIEEKADAIVFMIDGSDHLSISEAIREAQSLLNSPHVQGKPFLVIDNKKDKEGWIEVSRMEEMIKEGDNNFKFDILPCSSLDSQDVSQIIQWLISKLQ